MCAREQVIPRPGRQASSRETDADSSAPLRVQLLGSFSVTVGTRVVHDSEWYLRKARNLVKLLALTSGNGVHRGQLTEILWPEFDESAAANNLHKALHVARRVLEPDLPPKTPSSYIHMSGEFVSLLSDGPLWIDVRAFEEAADRAVASESIALYQRAIGLYTGDLLPEDRYEDWTIRQRDELRHRFLGLLQDMAKLYEQQGNIEDAISTLRRVVQVDHAHEQAHLSLMRLLASSGCRQQALRQFHQLRDALRSELDVEPDAHAQRLYHRLLNEEPGPVPVQTPVVPVVSMQEHVPGSPLIGREREVHTYHAALESLADSRGGMFLLTGDAGAGKSRLAVEFESMASHRGAITLWGAAYQSRTKIPYWPMRAALEGFALRVAPEMLEELLGEVSSILGAISPTIALVNDCDLNAVDTPSLYDMEAAMAYFLEQLSHRAPVILLLEDLHVADEMTLDLLARLSELVVDMPVIIICTLRPGEMVDDVRVSRLRNEALDSFDLSALDRDQLAQLVCTVLGGPVDEAILNLVYKLAEGNPYYAEEAAQALQGRNRLRQINGVWRIRERVTIAWDRGDVRQQGTAGGDFRLTKKLRVS